MFNRLGRHRVESIEYDLLPQSAVLRRRQRITTDANLPSIHAISIWRKAKLAARSRSVSREWTEKLWILVDQVQIFAILWITACPAAKGRFPFGWCVNTLWTPYVNADLNARWAYQLRAMNATASYDDDPAKVVLNGQQITWVVFAVPTFVLCSALIYTLFRGHLKRRLGLSAWIVPSSERLALWLLYYSYLPWQLLISRHVLCVEMQAMLKWQEKFTCDTYTPFQLLCQLRDNCLNNSAENIISFLVAALFVVAFSFGLPFLYYWQIRRGLVMEGSQHHDKWIRAIETEYLLEVSSFWSHHHYPLHTSCTRSWAYLLPIALLQKLALAWLLAALYKHPQGLVIRDLCIFTMLAVELAAVAMWPCFRLKSSQWWALSLIAANLITAAVRALMSLGFYTELFLLLGILLPSHYALAVLVGLLGILYHRLARRERWPTCRESLLREDRDVLALLRRYHARYGPPRLPLSAPAVEPGAQEEAAAREGMDMLWDDSDLTDMEDEFGWGGEFPRGLQESPVLGMVDRGRDALLEEQLRTPDFFRAARCRALIAALRRLLRAARRAEHGLEMAVEDVLEDAVAVHNAAVDRFRRAYPTCPADSLTDYPPLAPLLAPLRAAADRRDHVFLLAGPLRRRVMTKLAAVHAFVWLRLSIARAHAHERAAAAAEEERRRRRRLSARAQEESARAVLDRRAPLGA